MIRLAGASSFTWSTSEQVYPFEKSSDGSTLYCKEIDCGAGPNAGVKDVAHNIPSHSIGNLFDISLMVVAPGSWDTRFPQFSDGNRIDYYVTTANIHIITVADWTEVNLTAKIIYKK